MQTLMLIMDWLSMENWMWSWLHSCGFLIIFRNSVSPTWSWSNQRFQVPSNHPLQSPLFEINFLTTFMNVLINSLWIDQVCRFLEAGNHTLNNMWENANTVHHSIQTLYHWGEDCTTLMWFSKAAGTLRRNELIFGAWRYSEMSDEVVQ